MEGRRWGHAGRGMAKATLIKSCSSSCSAVFKGLLKQSMLEEPLQKQLLQTHQQGKYGEAWCTEEGVG